MKLKYSRVLIPIKVYDMFKKDKKSSRNGDLWKLAIFSSLLIKLRPRPNKYRTNEAWFKSHICVSSHKITHRLADCD